MIRPREELHGRRRENVRLHRVRLAGELVVSRAWNNGRRGSGRVTQSRIRF
jgi:hypothetical protein